MLLYEIKYQRLTALKKALRTYDLLCSIIGFGGTAIAMIDVINRIFLTFQIARLASNDSIFFSSKFTSKELDRTGSMKKTCIAIF